jgi:hypothetical protein
LTENQREGIGLRITACAVATWVRVENDDEFAVSVTAAVAPVADSTWACSYAGTWFLDANWVWKVILGIRWNAETSIWIQFDVLCGTVCLAFRGIMWNALIFPKPWAFICAVYRLEKVPKEEISAKVWAFIVADGRYKRRLFAEPRILRSKILEVLLTSILRWREWSTEMMHNLQADLWWVGLHRFPSTGGFVRRIT